MAETNQAKELEMTCENVVELLVELFDDELQPEQRARLDAHLKICPDCRSFANTYQATIGLAEDVFNRQLPLEARLRIEASMKEALVKGA